MQDNYEPFQGWNPNNVMAKDTAGVSQMPLNEEEHADLFLWPDRGDHHVKDFHSLGRDTWTHNGFSLEGIQVALPHSDLNYENDSILIIKEYGSIGLPWSPGQAHIFSVLENCRDCALAV